ncbi:MAG: hypothetical protein ACE5HS_23360 [bacterium]
MKSSFFSNNFFKVIIFTRQFFYLLLFFLVNLTPLNKAFAQVFTFDYLTYHANSSVPSKPRSYTATPYIFFGTNEFDAQGNSSSNNINYKEYHIHFAFALNFKEKIQLAIVPQVGLLSAKGFSSTTGGDIWFLGKYQFLKQPAIAFRLGFKLGKIGKSIWLKQNDFDIGLVTKTQLPGLEIGGVVSYRIRGKSEFDLLDFAGRFNEPGNAFHYKFELSKKIRQKFSVSMFLLGYVSASKKRDGIKLADSNSRKTTVGAAVKIRTSGDRSYKVGVLADAVGKHDKKGVAVVFSLSK